MTQASAEASATISGVGDHAYYQRWYADRDVSYYRPILSHLIRHGMPGPILDLGCGTGLLVECAQCFGLDAQGLDASPEAIAIGRARSEGLPIVTHDLSQPLPVADASVQSVVMNQVIEHLGLAVAEAVLREALRVLRPGGMIYVASPCRYNRRERDADPTHVHLFTPRELRSLLKRIGFTDVQQMDAPFRWPGCRFIWDLLGRPDPLCATATCRGYKPD